MLEMVVGFLFDMSLSKVMLIEKKRPKWQEGQINGPGGKIKLNETPNFAMWREFKEETFHCVGMYDFKNFVIINGSGWRVYFFHAITEKLVILPSSNDEKIIIAEVNNLPKNVLPSLNWLIPMALDQDLIRPVVIYEKSKWNGSKKEIVWED